MRYVALKTMLMTAVLGVATLSATVESNGVYLIGFSIIQDANAAGHFGFVWPTNVSADAADDGWAVLGGPVNQIVNDIVVGADDNVYIAGTFTAAGGASTAPQYMVARWNGSEWESVGGANDWIFALEQGPDGSLYAAGRFTQIGGIAASRVARWDGESWHAMGPGFNNPPEDLVFDSQGTLYAGGGMAVVGISGPRGIFAWNGTDWVVPGGGNGVNNQVYSLAVDADDNLYVGGTFSQVSGVAVHNVARWDGETWSDVGGGTQSAGATVYALTVDQEGNLYAGGSFLEMGGAPRSNLARWNGNEWEDVAGGVTGSTGGGAAVRAIAVDGARSLYIGGSFENAGGITVNSVARLRGNKWESLGSGVTNGTVVALAIANHLPYLYAGGGFSGMGGVGGLNYFARYDEGVVAPIEAEPRASRFALQSAYPNPFSDETHFRFTVARTQHVQLELFDGLGRRVAILFEGLVPAGQPTDVRLGAGALSSGTYLARLTGDGISSVRRVTLIR